MYGQGKYRLAPGYDHFYVEPTKWFKWSQERKDQHIRVFREFVPNIAETYKKPKNAGLKGNEKNKKRRDGKEPVLFVNQFENPDLDLLFDPEMLPKKRKVAENRTNPGKKTSSSHGVTEQIVPPQPDSEPSSSGTAENLEERTGNGLSIDPLDPDRSTSRMYYLVHRKVKKSCPCKS